MKKPVKIIIASLSTLLGVFLISLVVSLWFVFTPSRLTPIVRDVVKNNLKCQTEVGEVDLTFFSTFPEFGIRLSDLLLVNPKQGAASDTLASLKECVAIVDVMAYLSDNSVTVKKLLIDEGVASLYISSDSTTNFDIVELSDTNVQDEDTLSSFSLSQIALHDILIDRLSLSFIDEVSHMNLSLEDCVLKLSSQSNMVSMQGDVAVDLSAAHFAFALEDSVVTAAELTDISFEAVLRGQESALISEALHLELDKIVYNDAALSFDSDDLIIDFGHINIDSLVALRGSLDCSASMKNTRLRMSGAPSIDLTFDAVRLGVPQFNCASDGNQIKTDLAFDRISVKMDDETYVDRQPLSFHLEASSDAAFKHLTVDPASSISYADQKLHFAAQADVQDSLTTRLDLSLALDKTKSEDLWKLLPPSLLKELDYLQIGGEVDLKLVAGVTLHDTDVTIQSFDLKTALSHVAVSLDDDALCYQAPENEVHLYYPSMRKPGAIESCIVIPELNFSMSDSMSVSAKAKDVDIDMLISDNVLTGSTWLPYISSTLSVGDLSAALDTMDLRSKNTKAKVGMTFAHAHAEPKFALQFAGEDCHLGMGKAMQAAIGALKFRGRVAIDSKQEDLLLQYNPALDVELEKGDIEIGGMAYPLEIATIDFNFNLGKFKIHDSQLKIGNSDFRLQGEIDNLGKFIKKEDLLLGRLDFTSSMTDVYQLMDIVNGFGVEDSTGVASSADLAVTDAESVADGGDTIQQGDPFIVPKRVDFVLNTHIDKTMVGENEFSDLGGTLTIKDGVLVLEEMGFSSKAARMQLTALYRSDLRDHLFAGINFHLLDIEIADLIKMIPEVDTIIPMLSDFEGKAQFHLAAETNMKANYDLKLSTLKAVAAIEGKDLVLLDSETFSTIAKYCMFDKKSKNLVDSISVEMAVARRKATIYPFLISMDKYQAVVSGTHNITGDMGFNYNVSITDWPLPGIRPGVDVNGDLNDLSFKLLSKGKYAHLYRPEKRNLSQSKTLELKSMIQTALKRTVKE